jgi:hypothetical protein
MKILKNRIDDQKVNDMKILKNRIDDQRENDEPSNIENVIKDRSLTSGDWLDTARCARRIKEIIADEIRLRKERGQSDLAPTQLEALDMITHKEARIITGYPNYDDHWDDLAAYSLLGKKK